MDDQLKEYREEQAKKFGEKKKEQTNDTEESKFKFSVGDDGIHFEGENCAGFNINEDGIATIKTVEKGKIVERKYSINKMGNENEKAGTFEFVGSSNSNISLLNDGDFTGTVSVKAQNCRNIRIGDGLKIRNMDEEKKNKKKKMKKIPKL